MEYRVVVNMRDGEAGPGQCPRDVERQTYTIEEAAKILGICRALAYRKGVLPTVRIAGRLLVPKQALDRMLAEATEK
jgi:hypothetical protein